MKILKLLIILITFHIDTKSSEKYDLNNIIFSDNECKDFKNLEQIEEIKPFIKMLTDINKHLTYEGMINISKFNYDDEYKILNIIQRKEGYSETKLFDNFYKFSYFLKYYDLCSYKEKGMIIKNVWSDIPKEYLENEDNEELYEKTINHIRDFLLLINFGWCDIYKKYKE